jgi:arginine decarboxylase
LLISHEALAPTEITMVTGKQDHAPFVEALVHAANSARVPFFFPGHQMGRGAPAMMQQLLGADIFKYDLPEDVEELDCLCSPEGPILEAQQLAAEVFGAVNTWFLCNGSTGGLMAAILSLVQLHRRKTGASKCVFIVPRNCHKCVVQGLILSGADAADLLICLPIMLASTS